MILGVIFLQMMFYKLNATNGEGIVNIALDRIIYLHFDLFCVHRMFLHLTPIEAALSPESETESSPRKSTRSVVTGVMLATLHVICWTPYLITKFEILAIYM